jgi:hypothetical protein
MTNKEDIEELFGLYYYNQKRAEIEYERTAIAVAEFQDRHPSLTREQINDIMDKVEKELGVTEQ